MDTKRVALIRYQAPDGSRCVGSGLLVEDLKVLTADHVADGSRYRVECDRRQFGVAAVVRSESAEVDLAVLTLAGPGHGLERMSYARVERSQVDRVTGCVAVGFPRWNTGAGGRAAAQVDGYVPTADGWEPLASSGFEEGLLTLVGDRIPAAPLIPDGTLDRAPRSPWGGMSGAVVVAGDLVIGVVRSHNLAKGGQSLTFTPLTALERLPAHKRRQFWDALGVRDFNELQVLPGKAEKTQLTVRSSPPEFSAEVRDRYRENLAEVGLEVPDRWGRTELDGLRRDYQQRARGATSTMELLEALHRALDAMPVLQQVGGHEIAIRKLQDLYQRHVGRWPDSSTREGMLIMAASAGIVEQRRALSDPGYQLEPLTALARFMLGIAGHWKAPGTATLDDPDLRGLADWLTGTLGQQRDDAAAYLSRKVGGRTWALIELRAEDSAARAWPDRIVVDLVREDGLGRTHNVRCTAESEEAVLMALRSAISKLPEGEVCVDLLMPRRWLDSGVEHWEVVQVGGAYESMSRHLEPRLRWSMHYHDRWLRERLQRRFGKLAWLAEPEAIPKMAVGDPAQFAGWLDSLDGDRMMQPPYLIGSSASDCDHDPLGALLRDGYGFVVWFGRDTEEDVKQGAVHLATGMSALERRHDLPHALAARLKEHRPTIIWSDPDGRAGFQLPAPRRGGTLRRGAR